MKILFSELRKNFKNKTFTFNADDIDLPEVKFKNNLQKLILSVSSDNEEYYVIGKINSIYIETCDRCLYDFEKAWNSSLDFIISSKKNASNNYDVISFNQTQEFINISDILRDHFFINRPYKKLCKINCKGLCVECGINLNNNTCECGPSYMDTPWEKLKKIKF